LSGSGWAEAMQGSRKAASSERIGRVRFIVGKLAIGRAHWQSCGRNLR
jgi:hypothetical protein